MKNLTQSALSAVFQSSGATIYKNGDKLAPNNFSSICVNSHLRKCFISIFETIELYSSLTDMLS